MEATDLYENAVNVDYNHERCDDLHDGKIDDDDALAKLVDETIDLNEEDGSSTTLPRESYDVGEMDGKRTLDTPFNDRSEQITASSGAENSAVVDITDQQSMHNSQSESQKIEISEESSKNDSLLGLSQEQNGDLKSHTPSITSYFSQSAHIDDPFKEIVLPSMNSSGQLQLSPTLKLMDVDYEENVAPISKEDLRASPVQVTEVTPTPELILGEREVDRMYDAWIPSDSTRQIIKHAQTNPGGISLSPDRQTIPRMSMNDMQGDPLLETVYKLKGEAEALKRQVLNVHKVTKDADGFRLLIEAECWRSALDMSGILLSSMGYSVQLPSDPRALTITPEAVKIWSCRIALLMKLKMYSIAEAECLQFTRHDSPDLYYEYQCSKYPGRTGSMVPYAMRFLHSCLPQYLGRPSESLDRLFHIREIIHKIQHNLHNGLTEDGSSADISEASSRASLALWHRRELQVLYALAGCFCEVRDFRLAIKLYEDILTRDIMNKDRIYSAIGRVCLQMGAIELAKIHFSKSVQCCTVETDRASLGNLHSGYIAMCEGNHAAAHEFFSKSSSRETPNLMTSNNSAVSLLYNTKLKVAVLVLEELINSDPTKYLQETLLLNLCTLYELESSAATAKKQKLLLLANEYKGNGFNINCLKLT